MDPLLDQIALAVADSEDLEGLVRPLLGVLASLTGLESAYLTTVDAHRNVQRVVFSLNLRELAIPEGLEVPWGDTLCKRALEEGRSCVTDVPSVWGDSGAARELGIMTYVSEPIYIAGGALHGTLCGASATSVPLSNETRRVLVMFAKLIARQLEREALLARLEAENRTYSRAALTDPLTGIANRRALRDELERALVNAARSHTSVHVAFVDLDGFKAINDRLGHDAGDRFLIAFARVLADGMREGDFVARHGGDEFVVFGVDASSSHDAAQAAIRERIVSLTTRTFALGEHVVDYAGPSVGVVTSTPGERDVDALLARADAAMYEHKRARKTTRQGTM